jgi:hypothetical protein
LPSPLQSSFCDAEKEIRKRERKERFSRCCGGGCAAIRSEDAPEYYIKIGIISLLLNSQTYNITSDEMACAERGTSPLWASGAYI